MVSLLIFKTRNSEPLILDLRYALADEFFPEEVAKAENIIKNNPELSKEIYNTT